MKTLVWVSVGLLAVSTAQAQYRPVAEGSAVRFTIGNFGFDVDGSFSGLQGAVDFDAQHPEAAHFDVSVDAATVNTDNSLRDSHLRAEGYFDVKDFPRIRLVSTGIARAEKAGEYVFAGQLTIKGKTVAVSFPFSAAQAGDGIVFSGSFHIRRKDFGVGGTSTISNELTVSLRIITTKK